MKTISRTARPRSHAAVALIVLSLVASAEVSGQPMGTFDDQNIAARLERIEAKLDQLLGPQTAATFCISQGRGIGLGADWAVEVPLEVEGGAGWAEVGDVKLTAAPSFPIIGAISLPYLPPILIPIPTSVGVGVEGSLGKGLEICVEIPLDLVEEDAELLSQLAEDINTSGGPFYRSKFQRRLQRILWYAALRIPGGIIGNESEPAENIELEFDLADEAAEALLDEGVGAATEGLEVFKDQNIVALLENLEIPLNVLDSMSYPEKIFDGLPDLSSGIDLECQDLGVTTGMRIRNPQLDDLCDQLEDLPSFNVVKDAFETIEGLPDHVTAEVLDARQRINNRINNKTEEIKNRVTNRTQLLMDGQRKICRGVFTPCTLPF